MKINDIEFNCGLEEILDELIAQMRLNGIQYIQKMKPTSTHIQVSCPYHNDGMERRPSAGIRRDDGLFHCFACGEVHSLPEVISYCLGHPDDVIGKFGWNWLLKNFATIQVEDRKDVEIDLERNNLSNKSSILDSSANNQLLWVSEEELDSYRYYHPYWAKRGITDEEIIELFDLGYDKKTDCITFPNRDINGNCLFVARRSVKTKFFSYPQGVEKPLYGLYEYNTHQYRSRAWKNSREWYLKGQSIVICESMIDCLRLWQNGRYALALNGLGSESQFKQLRALPCRQYILATDMDAPGLRARDVLKRELSNKIVTEYFLPEGRKDIGDCTDTEIQNLQEYF